MHPVRAQAAKCAEAARAEGERLAKETAEKGGAWRLPPRRSSSMTASRVGDKAVTLRRSRDKPGWERGLHAVLRCNRLRVPR
jgi:hypothetical protein